MPVKFAVLLPLLVLVPYGLGDYKSYAGYKVYEIIPKTRNAQSRLRSIYLSSAAYDFWTMPKQIGKKSVVMVPPEYQKKFEKSLRKFKIFYTISVKDMAPLVRADRILQTSSAKTTIKNIQFKRYYRYNFILRYMDRLAKKYPDLVTVITIGQSYEKRKINAIHISNNNANGRKNTILIDAGIHGREWIGPATALYIIHQLVIDPKCRNMMNSLDWVILPVANPDGYEYTHTRERFWVKNRKPTSYCLGTDINRNFDFHWGEETGPSSNPCSETFRGRNAFSEPETRAWKGLMQSLNGTCKFYLSLNSFGQYLLYPWSYDDSQPNNWKDIDAVAQEGASAIRKATGTQYVVNSFSKALCKASGGSTDYAVGVGNIPISIAMTLPSGGREGVRGFHPQPSKIVSIAEESWIGIKAMAMLVDQKFNSVNTNDSTTVGPAGGETNTVVNTSSATTNVSTTESGDSTVANANGTVSSINSHPSEVSTSNTNGERTTVSPTEDGDPTNVNTTAGPDPTVANANGTVSSINSQPSEVSTSNTNGERTTVNPTEDGDPTNVNTTAGLDPTVANANGTVSSINSQPSEVSTSNTNRERTTVNPTEDSDPTNVNTTAGSDPTVANANGTVSSINVKPSEGSTCNANRVSTTANPTEKGESTTLDNKIEGSVTPNVHTHT